MLLGTSVNRTFYSLPVSLSSNVKLYIAFQSMFWARHVHIPKSCCFGSRSIPPLHDKCNAELLHGSKRVSMLSQSGLSLTKLNAEDKNTPA